MRKESEKKSTNRLKKAGGRKEKGKKRKMRLKNERE